MVSAMDVDIPARCKMLLSCLMLAVLSALRVHILNRQEMSVSWVEERGGCVERLVG